MTRLPGLVLDPNKYDKWAGPRNMSFVAEFSLDRLAEVGTQCQRAVIVQFLMARPPHGIAHSLYLDLGPEFQAFPICRLRQHKLRLPNLAR